MKKQIRIGNNLFERAPLWRRTLAAVIDLGFIGICMFIPFANFVIFLWYPLARDGFKFTKGASFGKLLTGLMVVSRSHGDHLGGDISSSITRSVTLILVVDFFLPFFRKDRKRIGDIFANTEVVIRKKIVLDQMSKDRYVDIVNQYYPIFLERDQLVEKPK